MPQSRHRKTSKAKKRPKGTYTTSGPGPQSSKARALRIVAIVIVVTVALSLVAVVVWWPKGKPEVTTASGLKYSDIVEGRGAVPQRGQTVTVNYTGTLENGTKFGGSDEGVPQDFRIGVGMVIKGWDEGLMSMKVGGKRRLIIPSYLGYGPQGRPPDIPPNATLLFDVELVGVK